MATAAAVNRKILQRLADITERLDHLERKIDALQTQTKPTRSRKVKADDEAKQTA
jgi:hypothetical protein